MANREDYAQLGRADPWLRGVGGLIWLFVGITRLGTQVPDEPALWLVPWVVYGVALFGAATTLPLST